MTVSFDRLGNQKHSRRSFIKHGSALGGAALLAGCTDIIGSSSSTQTVQVGHNPSSSPTNPEALVASLKGFDEEFGVEFELSEYGIGIDIMQDIAGGRLNFGVDGTGWAVMVTASKGIGLASHHLEFGDVGFVTNESIEQPSDLKGKSIARIEGSIFDYTTAQLLENYEISEDEVELLNMSSGSDMVATLQNDSVQGAWLWAQFLREGKDIGHTHVLANGRNVVPKTVESWGAFPIGREWAQNNVDMAANTLKAVNKAMNWVKEDKSRAASLLADELNVPEDDILSTMEQLTYYMGLNDDLISHHGDMQEFGVEKGHFEKVPMDTVVVEEPMQQALPDKVTWSSD